MKSSWKKILQSVVFCNRQNCMIYMKEDYRNYMRNLCSCEKKAWKKSGLYGIRTLELCDTGAALYQLSERANWEQVVELVRYKPEKGWWWSYKHMKIIYVNRGMKNYTKEDHRSYILRNVCSCEKKTWKKNSGLRDSNPRPLRYRCSALPVKLTSQLGAGRHS